MGSRQPARGLLEELKQVDHWLFTQINLEWTNTFFDWLFPVITDFHKNPWFPFVLVPILIFWIWKQRGTALKWIVILALSMGMADAVSYRIIKPMVSRERPPYSGIAVQLRTHGHSGLSFPSNHSANMFAAATTLSAAFPPLTPFFFLFALLVAYSRVYVGVHFPLDVFAGAILGITVALFIQKSATLVLCRFRKRPPAG